MPEKKKEDIERKRRLANLGGIIVGRCDWYFPNAIAFIDVLCCFYGYPSKKIVS